MKKAIVFLNASTQSAAHKLCCIYFSEFMYFVTSALLFSNAFKIAFALSIFEILFIVLSRAQEALFSMLSCSRIIYCIFRIVLCTRK